MVYIISCSQTSSFSRRVTIYIILTVGCITNRESFGTPIVFDARICVWPFYSAPLKICIRIYIYKKKHTIWPLSQKFSNSSIRAITPLNISITTLFHRETEYITITYAIKSYFIYDFIVSAKLWYCHRILELLPKYSKYLTGSNTIWNIWKTNFIFCIYNIIYLFLKIFRITKIKNTFHKTWSLKINLTYRNIINI